MSTEGFSSQQTFLMPTSEPSSVHRDHGTSPGPHHRDKTYVYLWTYRQFQQEQAEWSGVNKALRRHGYRPVQFADPVANKNLSDLVLLDKKAAAEIRAALRALLEGSERRRGLLQEATQSNNQLKEENQALACRAASQAQRAAELEGVLGRLKGKVQDLEDRYLARAVQQVQQDSLRRCRALEQQLCAERQTVAELQRKLHFTVREEERRRGQQGAAQPGSPSDQRVSENALEASQAPPGGDEACCDATPLRTALQSCQDQLEESRAQQQELRRRVQHLTQELGRRPTVKDMKSLKQQLRRMDRLVKHSAPRSMEEDGTPPTNHLEERRVPEYHNLVDEISSILTSTQNPLQRRVDTDLRRGLLQTLQMWANQISMLKDLYRGLRKLSVRLSPWRQADEGSDPEEAVRMEDLVVLVEDLLEDTAPEDNTVLRSPTRHTLQCMLGHFQTLFQVGSLAGVYPAMSRLHARLGEMGTATRALCHLLQLEDGAPLGAVVDEVARVLSESHGSGPQFPSLLTEGDIHSIITRVQEHEEFFPAFHSLVTDLLHLLGVGRLDDIVPAVRALQLQSQPSGPPA